MSKLLFIFISSLSLLCLQACDIDLPEPSSSPGLRSPYSGNLGGPLTDHARSYACSGFSHDAKQCSQQAGCDFLTSLTNTNQGACISQQDRKPDCSSVYRKEHCELKGISPNECVYIGAMCREKSEFDAQGFNGIGLHISGNFYNLAGFSRDGYYARDNSYNRRDPQGYDAQGYNQRGFNRAGLLASGQSRDARGFDANGLLQNGDQYDVRGFNADGNHRSGRISYINYSWVPVDENGFNFNGRRADGASLYDNRGFRADGTYRDTGTRFDDQGFDVGGYNQAGYNQAGFDRNGRDAQGVDTRGFRADGTHRDTGTKFDAQGYDIDGYNQAGYDRAGLDANGYDQNKIATDGFHVSGHRATDVAALETDGMAILPDNSEVPLSYSDRGMDQLGRFGPLKFGPLNSNERYGLDGDNAADVNFLGLTKTSMNALSIAGDPNSKKGFDAILDLHAVQAYPNDLGQLINNFNNSCYELKFKDPMTMDMEVITAANIVETVKGYQNYALDITHTYYLLIKEGRTNAGPKSDAEIEAALKKYLKKSIYFCSNFLYAGTLTKAQAANFDTLKLDTTSGIIKDQLPQPNYKHYLKLIQNRRNLDFFAIIERELNQDNILSGAQYNQENDRDSYGLSFDPTHPGEANKKLGVRFSHISDTLGVYKNGGSGKDYDRSQLFLRLVADKLASATLDQKRAIASEMAHAGAHCLDAKRAAVENAARLLASDEVAKYEAAALSILSNDNIQVALKKKLIVEKTTLYESWITETITKRGGNIDFFSTLSGTWNKMNEKLGLPRRENTHNFVLPNMITYMHLFFEPSKPVNPVNYPLLNLDIGNLVLNGGFSKELIYIRLYPDITDDSYMITKIMTDIFGPLWLIRSDANNIEINPSTRAERHTIMNALLLRLGLFKL